MKKWKRFPAALQTWSLVLFCAGTLMAGCQSPSQNRDGPESQTRLELTGNTMGSHVIIDNLLTFDVTNAVRTQFRLRPGRHHVRIEKGGAIVLDQMVLLTRGQTLDITVP